MQVTLTNLGKRFNKQWIFKAINKVFDSNKTYALVGNNGSGKSTLIQLIYNYQTISKGEITYLLDGKKLEEAELVSRIAFVAPYLELIEEFTLLEMLDFHFALISKQANIHLNELISSCGLAGNENKQIRYFSSGMKQRLKLILAFAADSPLLLLDEPCSNLDESGISWYRTMVLQQVGKRTVIIASNQQFEYDFCDEVLNVTDYK